MKAHFDCIAAPGDNCATHVLVVRPSDASAAASAPLHQHVVGSVDWRSNLEGSMPSEDAWDQIRLQSDDAALSKEPYGDLRELVSAGYAEVKINAHQSPGMDANR